TSKAVDEILAHAYWKAKGLPTVIVRLFNALGPRQSPDYGMVLPRFIEAALEGRMLKVHGDGSQSRCFGHVRDIVPALMALMESREAEGLAVNLGSQEEVTILQLAKLVIERTGSSSEVQLVPYRDVYVGGFEDMPRRVPDLTRARKLIGFEPVTSPAEIVASAWAMVLAVIVHAVAGSYEQVATILGGGLVLAGMGLVDDLKVVPGWIKVPLEIVAALALYATGVAAHPFKNVALDLPLNVAWVVGITNAVNYMDNMDGLSAGVVAIAAGYLFVLAALSHQI